MSERLKRISEVFTEDEFKRLKTVKEETSLSWHDFLLEILEVFTKSRKLEELRSSKEKTGGR